MAQYLLKKHPEVLLGGDTLESGEARCRSFWEKFQKHQPHHKVFEHLSDCLGCVIPICLHGDKGRTLKKSPIACYSWESIWGLPRDLRDTAAKPAMNRRTQQKYDTGRLGATCFERSMSMCPGSGAKIIDKHEASKCTIQCRSLGDGEIFETHNSLGSLILVILLDSPIFKPMIDPLKFGDCKGQGNIYQDVTQCPVTKVKSILVNL